MSQRWNGFRRSPLGPFNWQIKNGELEKVYDINKGLFHQNGVEEQRLADLKLKIINPGKKPIERAASSICLISTVINTWFLFFNERGFIEHLLCIY